MHLIWDQKPKALVKEQGFNMQMKGCVSVSISYRMKKEILDTWFLLCSPTFLFYFEKQQNKKS